ncbi:FUSC family protein [Comamonas testosteroni]|uniref:FUSC family protein n=1 Tax=Comamonas testosteroni TaxID=285 RepID=UPI0006B8A3E0|nr:FUSC family protein [Comamonas testosteroni]
MSTTQQTPSVLLTGLRLGITALIAFVVAAFLEIPHPYWAAMPVWAMSQPTRGLLLERGLFRLLGTVVGAIVGFGILHAQLPFYFASAVLALWVALMTAAIPLLRGAHGYAPLLAAMTAGIVVIPGLFEPVNAWTLAMSRVDCTFIGMIVGFACGYLSTPASPLMEVRSAVRHLGRDTLRHAAAMLRKGEVHTDALAERVLLRDLAEVQAKAQLMGVGRPSGYKLANDVQAMAYAAVEVLAAVHAYVERRHADASNNDANSHDQDRFAEALESVSDRFPEALHQDVSSFVMSSDPRLHHALHSFVGHWRNLVDDANEADGTSVFSLSSGHLSLFLDERSAVRGGISAGAATYLTCCAAHLSGVPQAGLVTLAVCMVSTLLASHAARRTIGVVVFKGAVAGVAAALLYRLWVLPHVDSLPFLFLSIAPFLLLGGLARANPRTAGIAFDANQLFLITSHAAIPAEHQTMFEAFLGSGALLLGVGVTCFAYALYRPQPRRTAQRVVGKVWKAIQCLCDSTQHEPRVNKAMVRHIFHLSRSPSVVGDGSPMAALRLLEAIVRLHALKAKAQNPLVSHLAAQALLQIRDAGITATSQGLSVNELTKGCSDAELERAVRDADIALCACRWAYELDTNGRVNRAPIEV